MPGFKTDKGSVLCRGSPECHNGVSRIIHFNAESCGSYKANFGGFKVADPGLDLAIVAAVVSSYYDRAVADGVCCAGEVGLSGEVRPAPRTEQRVIEAARLGFRRIIVSGFLRKTLKVPKNIDVVYINNIGELPPALFCEEF